MATLANIFNHLTGAGTIAETASHIGVIEVQDAYRLRALPNEDVFFYVKRIDNSRVVKQANPRQRASEWRLVGGAGFAAVALIALLLPGVYSLLAGYQISSLESERHRLVSERSTLEIEEARAMSPERIQALAKEMGLLDPSSERTVYVQPRNTFAHNR